MYTKKFTFLILSALLSMNVGGQEEVTNAFHDLQRTGIVQEDQSIMRKVASDQQVEALIQRQPDAGFFCFTEDREHDIRLKDQIPFHWIERTEQERSLFKGKALPGEFYTWQIGVYAPYNKLEHISVSFSDLKNERGDKIKASALTCFNTNGIDKYGKPIQFPVQVEKGDVQPLWIGMDIPTHASGVYKGNVWIHVNDEKKACVSVELRVSGEAIANHGDDEGWRKTRLRWLNATIGNDDKPTTPYTPVTVKDKVLTWLGGKIHLTAAGLPSSITTCYDANNNLSDATNEILAEEMKFIIETDQGEEILKGGKVRILKQNQTNITWSSEQSNSRFQVSCNGDFGFDGISNISIQVKAKQHVSVKDIRLEVPYSSYASKYMMGLGHKGGFRPDSLISWNWEIEKHQDKIWMGNVNAGMNLRFMNDHFVRPLVNIYYALGKLNLPESWGNQNKGGINIYPTTHGTTKLVAYSGERSMEKGDKLSYNFDMQITPVKPINWKKQVTNRFYHSNSDLSANYIDEALKNGANLINVHHKKDIYPFINYPYHDDAVSDLKAFIQKAHQKNLGVRLYYTTRELTVKIPELWALRSLGSEVIHDGPGKDTRTLIHPNGPNEWLNKNLTTHFIPAWYNAFNEGKYAGDMDISVITTPDSRWNNYYLAGLDWMVKNLGIDGVYIDDSALDRKTIQRARRILDSDGKERLIDIHSWNHMNKWAGFANSLHLYTELLPYVDRTWIGEGFPANNTADFWLVEMSGIPFGLLSETLDARNQFRGLVYGMLPRLPWSGNPVPLWNLFDQFDMKNASIHGYWDEQCPVKTDNKNLPATVFVNGDKALVVIANWTDLPQTAKIQINEKALGFKPTKFTLPEVRNLQWGGKLSNLNNCEILGRSGMIVWLEK